MKALVYLLPASLLMVACTATPLQSGSGTSGEKTQSPVDAVGQSTLPPGVTFRPENSLIIGAGEQWVGRVVADVGRDVEAAFRFFIDTYPAQGWTLISSVRGKTSLLVFTKQDRTATVELSEGGMMGGGALVLTVSPRNAAVVAPPRR
ncbi:MAG: hypothetical protein FJY42_07140 [Betaproteobacteria bacterium]|nr:hypothetical protein [Betaproteobacteria bacterium]